MNRAPPWTSETLAGGFKVLDANGQSLAYVYGHAYERCSSRQVADRGCSSPHSEQHRQAAELASEELKLDGRRR